jgi:Transglutaminase-like superfamily
VSRRLFLRSHVFLCRGKRHWVILDANRGKYHCVGRRQFEALGPSLEGWKEPADSGAGGAGAMPEVADEIANALLSEGILSEHPADTKDALPTDFSHPRQAIDLDCPEPSRWSTWIHAGTFFASCLRASRQLSRQPFQVTVEAVRARKSRYAARADATDLERARSLVLVFNRLRWYYPRPYLCLFDSLALIHFLACFHLFPDWVFGVSADPFEAHCTVQLGSVVLNDTVERVSALVPIMFV